MEVKNIFKMWNGFVDATFQQKSASMSNDGNYEFPQFPFCIPQEPVVQSLRHDN
jgi:hypothetical protein